MTIRYNGKLICCCCANCTHDCGVETVPNELYECALYRFCEERFNKAEHQAARARKILDDNMKGW